MHTDAALLACLWIKSWMKVIGEGLCLGSPEPLTGPCLHSLAPTEARGLAWAKHIGASVVKYLDRTEMNQSKGIWPLPVCLSRTRVW